MPKRTFPTDVVLRYIEEYKDPIEDSLQDLFGGSVEDYLSDNCKMVTEDYGEDWLDRDIKAAKEEIKMKFQDFINNIK